MRSRRLGCRCVALLGGALVLIGSLKAQAQDWPQWRGPKRDGKASFQAPATWPKELAQKWKVSVGSGDASPALVGDRLYVFSFADQNEVLRCLEAATGKEIWKQSYETQGATGPSGGAHAGPRSSPIVADGRVVTLGVRGILTGYDAETGKILWQKNDGKGSWPTFFTASSPIVTGGLCIAQLGGANNGYIFACDLSTGGEKWHWTGDGASYASPVLAMVDGVPVIVAQSDKHIVALSAEDGKQLWEEPFAGRGMGGYNTATPIVRGQTLIVSGSGRGTKALKLEKSGNGFSTTEIWTNADNSISFNSPVLKNNLIFGLSGKDSLFCIRAGNGETAWTSAVPGKRGFGSIVDAGPVLMALTPTAQLTIFSTNDKEFKPLASYKVSDQEVYSYPVPAGNRIYIKDADSVALWALE